jgi:hypothetical protein
MKWLFSRSRNRFDCMIFAMFGHALGDSNIGLALIFLVIGSFISGALETAIMKGPDNG